MKLYILILCMTRVADRSILSDTAYIRTLSPYSSFPSLSDWVSTSLTTNQTVSDEWVLGWSCWEGLGVAWSIVLLRKSVICCVLDILVRVLFIPWRSNGSKEFLNAIHPKTSIKLYAGCHQFNHQCQLSPKHSGPLVTFSFWWKCRRLLEM